MTTQRHLYERYDRQMLLPAFGQEGQRKLLLASVLVVGAGGLGCPALQYLAAAGIGKIGIVDDDTVSLHNLHRQVLYATSDVGLLKAEVAAKRLQEMNPDLEIEAYAFRLTTQNALSLLAPYNLVIDATDNFAARYLINDACVLLNKAFVYGAISQFDGQVAVFNAGERATNYRDLFPQPPPPGSVLNCAEAGVLGVLPGIIGTMQATEVIKLLTGIGKPLINQLFTYNALTNESFIFLLTASEQTALLLPKTKEEFEAIDYEWLCGSFTANEVECNDFSALIQQPGVVAIDVREEGEEPVVNEFAYRQIPLSSFAENSCGVKEKTIVLFCQSGKRSREAARILSAGFGDKKRIYSLKGGIVQWKRQHGKEA